MIRLLLLLVLLPTSLYAQALDTTKPVISAPKEDAAAERCYDAKGQAKLDEALELGVGCVVELRQAQDNLEGCRKWRDRYKDFCVNKDMTALEIEPEIVPVERVEVKENNSRLRNSPLLKYGAVAVSFFTLGVLATKVF